MVGASARRERHWQVDLGGAVSVLCAATAWVEWFGVPLLLPHRGGPVPYLYFAPFVVCLFLLCLYFGLRFLVLEGQIPAWKRLLYGLPPAGYVVFHVSRLLVALL